MTLLGSRVFASKDVVIQGSIRVWILYDWCPDKNRRDIDTLRERLRGAFYKLSNARDCQQHWKLGRSQEGLSRAFGESTALLTPRCGASSSQNCARTNFCCFKAPSLWLCVWQPQEADTHTYHIIACLLVYFPCKRRRHDSWRASQQHQDEDRVVPDRAVVWSLLPEWTGATGWCWLHRNLSGSLMSLVLLRNQPNSNTPACDLNQQIPPLQKVNWKSDPK